MRRFTGVALISLAMIIPGISSAQNGCFEIERILVASCSQNWEGYNEMLYLRIGPNPISTSNMQVTFPVTNTLNYYDFLGLVQNEETAAKVLELNSTIQSCGYFKEPANGILPANAKVIMFTSYKVDPFVYSFADLSDTLVAIFQNNPDESHNRTGGHFVNSFYDPEPYYETTFVSFAEDCWDEVTFICQNLPNFPGPPPSSKGKTVTFTPDGTPSYFNNGCSGTSIDYNAEWSSPGDMCANHAPVELDSLIMGTMGGTWSGTGIQSRIFHPSGLSGEITLTYTLPPLSTCPDMPPASVSKTFQVFPDADAGWTNPDTLCSHLDSLDLSSLITGTPGGNWTGWNVQSNGMWNLKDLVGTFPVVYMVGTGDCRDSLLQQVTVLKGTEAKITAIPGTSLCQTNQIILKSAKSGFNLWSTQEESDSILVQEPGTYTLSRTGICDTDKDTIVIEKQLVSSHLTASPDSGSIPLTVEISLNSSGADSCWWFYNDSLFMLNTQSSLIFLKPGSYTIRQICSNKFGCMDSSSETIWVGDPNLVMEIPNVFSPNGDQINDLFAVKHKAVKNFYGQIYNRWGKKLFEWTDVNSGWDGSIQGEPASDGVYFYIIKGSGVQDQTFEFKGSVQLISSKQ